MGILEGLHRTSKHYEWMGRLDVADRILGSLRTKLVHKTGTLDELRNELDSLIAHLQQTRAAMTPPPRRVVVVESDEVEFDTDKI